MTWHDRVLKTDDCWLWLGCTNDKGYGQVRVNGKTRYVHVLAYEEHYGPIPEGLQVDHFKCYVHHCVNPTHLRAATHAQNQQNRKAAKNYYWSEREQKYKASIMRDGKRIHIGSFSTLEEVENAIRSRKESGVT